MRYVTGIDEKGSPIDVRDPLAKRLRVLADEAGPDAARLSRALLGLREVFGDDLSVNERFSEAVRSSLALLFEVGAKDAVRRVA